MGSTRFGGPPGRGQARRSMHPAEWSGLGRRCHDSPTYSVSIVKHPTLNARELAAREGGAAISEWPASGGRKPPVGQQGAYAPRSPQPKGRVVPVTPAVPDLRVRG